MKHIDPHVHCRDGREAYKTTIREVSELAKNQGIVAIIDKPNTDPPILGEKEVEDRLTLAKRRKPVVEYFVYVGLTADEKQIIEAVKLAKNHSKVAGLDLHTPEMAEKDQEKVYQILADLDYIGVLDVHCEKRSELKPELWIPERPWSHSLARPPAAEIASGIDQINFAIKTKFKGHLHISHISCPELVEIVWQVKKRLNISCGVTPHHILFTEDLLKEPHRLLYHGLLYKVNPPLRNKSRVERLKKQLFEGKIDWIETDHAPHTKEEKLDPNKCPSGLASLNLYQRLLVRLSAQGMIQSDIERLTYWNIKKVFGSKLWEV